MTLEDAANVLIGEEEEGQTKYKSKENIKLFCGQLLSDVCSEWK